VTQNIYDNPEFFDGYSQLPRSRQGLAGAPEWPALRALLPPMSGQKVVDLGCGYGWFCRWATEQGAERVLGLDVSEKMLERAVASTHDSRVSYQRADLERLEFARSGFTLAYSSLAFHYISDLAGLLRTVHDALIPGGRRVRRGCTEPRPVALQPRADRPVATAGFAARAPGGTLEFQRKQHPPADR